MDSNCMKEKHKKDRRRLSSDSSFSEQSTRSSSWRHGNEEGAGLTRKKKFWVLLVGKDGTGKRSTSNTILEKKEFPVSTRRQDQSPLLSHKCETSVGVVKVTICTGPTDRSYLPTLRRALEKQPHAILFVIKLGAYDSEDHAVFRMLKEAGGSDILPFIVIVFTGGDLLRPSDDIMRGAPRDLQRVLKKCENRYVIFNNKAKNKLRQVESLFELIETLIRENGGAYCGSKQARSTWQSSEPGRTQGVWQKTHAKNKPGTSTVKLPSQSEDYRRQSSSTSKRQPRYHEEEREEMGDSDERETEDYESDESSAESQGTEEVENEDEKDSQNAQQHFHCRKRAKEKWTTKSHRRQKEKMENADITDEDGEKADKDKETKRKRKAGPVQSCKGARGMAENKHVGPYNSDTPLKPSGATEVLADETKDMEHFRFLMLGKTGSGKSTTGNTILGDRYFHSASSFSSVTTECAMKEAVVEGAQVEILDCPGLCDTSRSDEEIGIVIIKAVVGLHPGPQAILYVLKAERFTAEEYAVFQKLQNLFDQHMFRYLIVIITGGDNFEYDGQSEQQVINSAPPELKELLNDCDSRYVVFNNRAQDPKPQVCRLLQMVRKMVTANGNESHYRCPKYNTIGEELEKEVRRKLAEVEQKNLQKQRALQNHNAKQKKKMEDELQKQKDEIEKKVANKEMTEAEAQKKLKKLQDEHDTKLKKLDKKLADMKKQDEEDMKGKGAEIEKTLKTETVEGGGLVAKLKGGAKQICNGFINIAAAPLESVSAWWSSG